jgi:hypothetical protein
VWNGTVNLRPGLEFEQAKVGNDWPMMPQISRMQTDSNAENAPKVGKRLKLIFSEGLS